MEIQLVSPPRRHHSAYMHAIRSIGLVAIACLPLTSVSCMPGQRLLTIQIEVDGSVVYEGSRGVPDNTSVTEMWEVLGDVRFEPSHIESSSSKEGSDSIRFIEGEIVLRIVHVKDALADAQLDELKLRYDAEEDAWRLEKSEVGRIKTTFGK